MTHLILFTFWLHSEEYLIVRLTFLLSKQGKDRLVADSGRNN